MSERHDAMWGADAAQYIAQQEAEIDRLRAALKNKDERILDVIAEWANQEGISFDATTRLSKALAKEEK